MDKKELRNKVAGALYGMALGDAMGMPAELWGRKKARDFFGKKIEGLMDGPAENEVACNYKRGQFTDDTAQALVILDSIAATGYVPDARDIAVRMIAWAEKENAWEKNILGPTSKAALSNFRDGIKDTTITDGALSNGSAMRIPPVGCLFLPERKQEIVDYVYGVSRATHTSDVTIAGASMIAVGVSSAIVNDDFEKVIGDILAIEELGYKKGCETFSARLKERTKIALEIAGQEYEDEEQFAKRIYDVIGTGVGITESVPAAIAAAYYAQDPNRCSLLCANMGGDTDTIGAMATAICGAFTGADAIKKEYIKVLKEQNDVDFEYYIEILLKGRGCLSWGH